MRWGWKYCRKSSILCAQSLVFLRCRVHSRVCKQQLRHFEVALLTGEAQSPVVVRFWLSPPVELELHPRSSARPRRPLQHRPASPRAQPGTAQEFCQLHSAPPRGARFEQAVGFLGVAVQSDQLGDSSGGSVRPGHAEEASMRMGSCCDPLSAQRETWLCAAG